MSRSIKHSPVCKHEYHCSKTRKYYKRQASKTIRKSQAVANGKAYKKYYNRYNICDYRFYTELNDWLKPSRWFVTSKNVEDWKRWYLWK